MFDKMVFNPSLLNEFIFQEGHFVWESSGVPLSYVNWGSGAPYDGSENEDCLYIYSPDMKWGDDKCGVSVAYKPFCQLFTIEQKMVEMENHIVICFILTSISLKFPQWQYSNSILCFYWYLAIQVQLKQNVTEVSEAIDFFVQKNGK